MCSKQVKLSGKWRSMREQLSKQLPKATFLYPHHSYMKIWIKLETMYKPPQGLQVYTNVPFVTFEPAILESIGNKHTHTVVSPPYPIHLGEKNRVKSHSKVASFQSEVPEGGSIL